MPSMLHNTDIFRQSIKIVLQYFNGNSFKALVEAFPNIGLNETRFPQPSNPISFIIFRTKCVLLEVFWQLESRRREFFESFSRDNGFDPLVPENWLSAAESLNSLHVCEIFTVSVD